MIDRRLGLIILLANVVTPIVGVTCGFIAQSRYMARLRSLPFKVAERMPKRFPMADTLIGLFILGPLLGIAIMVTLPDNPSYSRSTLNNILQLIALIGLVPINLSGPHLIKIGMPPDGTFKLDGAAPNAITPGKPNLKQSTLFDAREI